MSGGGSAFGLNEDRAGGFLFTSIFDKEPLLRP
jgi:hypothetical protein